MDRLFVSIFPQNSAKFFLLQGQHLYGYAWGFLTSLFNVSNILFPDRYYGMYFKDGDIGVQLLEVER
jgi:hypothetical protein